MKLVAEGHHRLHFNLVYCRDPDPVRSMVLPDLISYIVSSCPFCSSLGYHALNLNGHLLAISLALLDLLAGLLDSGEDSVVVGRLAVNVDVDGLVLEADVVLLDT